MHNCTCTCSGSGSHTPTHSHSSPFPQVAAALLGASVPTGNCQARVLAFIGGPCTEGNGKIVGRELAEEVRSHKVRWGGLSGHTG